VRGRIYGYIENHPGCHYNEILKNLGIKNGTLSHHLYILEKTGMIKSRREGLKYRAFYTTGMEFPEKEKYRLTNLQVKILEKIKEKEGITQKELATLLGEKKQTINYNIKVLQRAGKITLKKKGRITKCYTRENKEIKD